MKLNKIVNILILVLLCIPNSVYAEKCVVSFAGPSDWDWDNMLNFRMGSATLVRTDAYDPEPASSNPVCVCSSGGATGFGLNISFGEPVGFLESASPWCFPSLGIDLGDSASPGAMMELEGGVTNPSIIRKGQGSYSAQVHDINLPAFRLLGLFADLSCLSDDSGIDISAVTEVIPWWNKPASGYFINPESGLFGNILTKAMCVGPRIASVTGLPNPGFFWCPDNYPWENTVGYSLVNQGSANLVNRYLFMKARTALLWDANLNVCGNVQSILLNSNNFWMQRVRPHAIKGQRIRFNMPALLWESQTFNAGVTGESQIAYILFRKNTCCLYLYNLGG